MKIIKYLLSIPLLLLALIQPVMATTTGMQGSSMIAAGPLDILVSLGIENVPGVSIQYALLAYRFISFAIIMVVALLADRRTQETFSIIIVAIAALMAFFGWFTVLLPDGTINPAGPWSIIILCALMVVVSYMTSQNQLNFGITGAGDPVIKIFMFLVLFSAFIGVLNSTQVFASIPGIPNSPQVCTNNNYANCQVSGANELSTLGTSTSAGGFFSNLSNYVTMFTTAAVSTIIMILSILLSVAAISVTLITMYPWILSSPPAMLFIGIIQFVIYIFYYLTLVRWTAKTTIGEARL